MDDVHIKNWNRKTNVLSIELILGKPNSRHVKTAPTNILFVTGALIKIDVTFTVSVQTK